MAVLGSNLITTATAAQSAITGAQTAVNAATNLGSALSTTLFTKDICPVWFI